MGSTLIELKSLLLGLVCSLGVFAIKAGAGLAYVEKTSASRITKALFPVCMMGAYAGIFLISWYVATTMDMVHQFNRITAFFQSGLLVHFLMAGGMLVWSYTLLASNQEKPVGRRSYGWIPLVMPCPVCAAAIFVTTCFMIALFPGDASWTVVKSYSLFAGVTVVTAVVFGTVMRLSATSAERVLGIIMLFTALYFLVSLLVVPHSSDLDRVYRLAAYSTTEDQHNRRALPALIAISSLALGAGFVGQMLKQRSV